MKGRSLLCTCSTTESVVFPFEARPSATGIRCLHSPVVDCAQLTHGDESSVLRKIMRFACVLRAGMRFFEERARNGWRWDVYEGLVTTYSNFYCFTPVVAVVLGGWNCQTS